MSSPTVTVQVDPVSVALLAAQRVLDAAGRAVQARRRFTLILAGGSTPKALYTLLATRFRSDMPWHAVTVLFGDERCVGPEHPDSNYRMAFESMLKSVPVDPTRVLRIAGEAGPARAADDYNQAVRDELARDPAGQFDMVLLGMGADGHTASLFPGRDFAIDRGRYASPAVAPPASPISDRVTLTLDTFRAARTVLFMVTGADKKTRLAQVLEAARAGGDPSLPASMVQARGSIEWIVDQAAVT